MTELATITCPRCGMTSAHPDDVREGYCGNCHDWTTPRPGALGERLLEDGEGDPSGYFKRVGE